MKKLLLIPALLGSMAIAQEYKYEITPVIGYNIAEGNLNLENQFLVGAEFQLNTDTFFKPELSVLFTDTDYEDLAVNESTDIWRVAANAVHDFDPIGAFTPLIKFGIGYESIENNLADNDDALFIDAGVGVKTFITDSIALKLEAVYMNKETDSNFAVLAGINFAFGPKSQPAPVDGDDDNDGVLNSVDQCPTTPAGTTVDATGCKVDGDDDNDGVLNSVDKCPTTPAGNVVDSDGCTQIVNLHVNFENNSFVVDAASQIRVKKFANFLIARSNFTAKITGHTNSIGRESSNQILSENRANAVRDLIVEYGVAQDRVTASGEGESNPIASNDTAEGLAQNRRIEATLNKN